MPANMKARRRRCGGADRFRRERGEKMEKTIVRDATPGDASRILEIYSYYVTDTAITFEYVIPSTEEFRQRMRQTMQKYPYLVIEEDGDIQGYAYAGVFKDRAAYDWACEMTVYIDRNAQRRGLGRMIYEALEAKLKAMGILTLYACIAYPEKEDEYLTRNSVMFHKRLGYTLAGTFRRCGYKFDRWYDMVWMEKIIGGHTQGQRPVTAYPETARKRS